MRFMTADFAAVPPELYSRLFEGAHVNGLYEELPAVAARAACLSRNGVSYLTRMCLDDTKHFLPDHNLTYSDKATMAASVEGRPPLIDHRIVEFMFSLPPRQRIRGWKQKYLLKKSAEGLLPDRIINRPKAPFGAPLRSWIRRDLREMVDDVLSPSAMKNRGLFNPETVRKLIQADQEGKEDNALLIWSILTREIWFRTFIDHSIKAI
jgi:asparagine synthase (glutamine-hydrolysing)